MATKATRSGGTFGLCAMILLAPACTESGPSGGGTTDGGPEPVVIRPMQDDGTGGGETTGGTTAGGGTTEGTTTGGATGGITTGGATTGGATTGGSGIPEQFVGLWQSDCIVEDELSLVQQLLIEEPVPESGAVVYLDTACTNPIIETRVVAALDFGDPVTLADGAAATEVDVVLTGELRATPLSGAAALGLSLERACGRDDWTDGVSYDVSDCDTFNEASALFNRVARQIYSVQGDNLYVGLFVTTPERPVPIERPVELNYITPFRRVER